ncbi:hypothetical protein BaRGS_00007349 [Batillaria attramentaria]|uniref:Major facilitator superfamily (MFS) profile domain-containing protein n=1 Tax=Batillaria attramentaria TaxID=370345 RepID=A0ABD0LPR9_9CAEN
MPLDEQRGKTEEEDSCQQDRNHAGVSSGSSSHSGMDTNDAPSQHMDTGQEEHMDTGQGEHMDTGQKEALQNHMQDEYAGQASDDDTRQMEKHLHHSQRKVEEQQGSTPQEAELTTDTQGKYIEGNGEGLETTHGRRQQTDKDYNDTYPARAETTEHQQQTQQLDERREDTQHEAEQQTYTQGKDTEENGEVLEITHGRRTQMDTGNKDACPVEAEIVEYQQQEQQEGEQQEAEQPTDTQGKDTKENGEGQQITYGRREKTDIRFKDACPAKAGTAGHQQDTQQVDKQHESTQQEVEQPTDKQGKHADTEDRNGQAKFDTAAMSHLDGGWAWVVCFASMYAYGTVTTLIRSFGIIYVEVLDQLSGVGVVSFKTSWVGSLSAGLIFLMSVPAGVLCDRLGIRKVTLCGGLMAFVGMLSSSFVTDLVLLYLTYGQVSRHSGLILGVGMGLTLTPSLAILGLYFKRRLGLANAIVTAGTTALSVTYVLLLPKLFDVLGLKFTLLCLSGAVFLLLPCALTRRPVTVQQTATIVVRPDVTSETPSPEQNGSDSSVSRQKLFNTRIWRNKRYVLWVAACAVASFGQFPPLVHLVKHSNDLFPSSDGNLVLFCMNVSSAVSRVIFGILVDRKNFSRVHVHGLGYLLMGVSTACTPLADTFIALLVLSCIYGLGDGIFSCLLGPIAVQLVGPQDTSQALGCLFGLVSLGMTLGPPLAGILYDFLGSYTIAFHTAGTLLLIGGLLLCLVFPRQEKVYCSDLHFYPPRALLWYFE